jgi:hypothetical protein
VHQARGVERPIGAAPALEAGRTPQVVVQERQQRIQGGRVAAGVVAQQLGHVGHRGLPAARTRQEASPGRAGRFYNPAGTPQLHGPDG